MAAQPISDRPVKTGARKHLRSMNPHMDFTPMVDLGFLLITFFMLSTTLSKPVVMPVVMPDREGIPDPVKQSKVLTLILGSNDNVYWYEGLDQTKMDSTRIDHQGLRQVILRKMDRVQEVHGLQSWQDSETGETRLGSHLNVIIKPGHLSRFKNLVDALDELYICRVRYYCIVDPLPEEAKK